MLNLQRNGRQRERETGEILPHLVLGGNREAVHSAISVHTHLQSHLHPPHPQLLGASMDLLPPEGLAWDQHPGGCFVLNSRKLSPFTPYKMAWVSLCCPAPSMGLPSTLNRAFLRQGLSSTSAACSAQSTQEASLTGYLGINPKSWWYYSAALQFSSTRPPSFIHSTSVSGKPAKSEPRAID